MGNVTLSSPVSWFRRCVPSALIHIHSYDGADLLIRCLANRENNVRPLHSLMTLSCIARTFRMTSYPIQYTLSQKFLAFKDK